MSKRTGPTNINLKGLIQDLKELASKEKAGIWKKAASELERSARNKKGVNIEKINKHVRENETALVTGKVLSDGELTKKITVAALMFSEKAKEKINKTGKAISIRDLMKNGSKGKRIRIIK